MFVRNVFLVLFFSFAVIVTVERLIAIKWPFLARKIWTKRRLAVITVTVYLLSFILQLPNVFFYKPVRVPNCEDLNRTVIVLGQLMHQYSELGKHFFHVYTVACPIIVVALPLTLLIILNSFLLHLLRVNRRTMTDLGSTNHNMELNERKVTIMVMVVVLIFFVFNLPSAVIYICTLFVPPNHLADYALVSNYIVTLDKSLNLPLYCCSSELFRNVFKKTLEKLFPRITTRDDVKFSQLIPPTA